MEYRVKVRKIKNYGSPPHAQQLWIERPESFAFKAGQFIMVAVEGFALRSDPSQLKWTSYSLCSSPQDQDLGMVYTIRRTGGFTQHLAEHLKEGDELLVKGPYGNFVLEENAREKLFIATGAGIAPLLSMVKHLGGPYQLLYGFRTGEDFLCREEIAQLSGQVRTCISRDDASWEGERGHVQDLLETATLNPGNQDVYICGNPKMVEDVSALLKEKGFPAEAIKQEQW